ncbi:hypothetical protein ILYODFUR_035947 [Ilyodon furcidens]|uniref:Uncharacterized protein n=1 Tax=Ilyodon furcidens TaxID=33524 RepID=A0ABV0SU58_9TELE
MSKKLWNLQNSRSVGSDGELVLHITGGLTSYNNHRFNQWKCWLTKLAKTRRIYRKISIFLKCCWNCGGGHQKSPSFHEAFRLTVIHKLLLHVLSLQEFLL